MAAVSITYAGQPLLILDPQLHNWLEKWYDLDQINRIQTDVLDRSPCISRIDPPKMKVNQLYWPLGAQRWSSFWGLTTAIGKDAIASKYPNSRTMDVIPELIVRAIHEAGGREENLIESTLTAKMWLLPPIPVTYTYSSNTTRDDSLWLLPLVDQRYWWQFRDVGAMTLTKTSTWANLFSDLGSAIGVTIDLDDVNPYYLNPDPVSFNQDHHPAPSLLDAAAYSIGHRIIAGFDGTVKTQSFSSARPVSFEAEATSYRSGGNDGSDMLAQGAAPEKVAISCGRIRHYVPRKDGLRHVYRVDHSIDEYFPDSAVTPGTEKIIRTTAYADFTAGGATPSNTSSLHDLATQITTDYYLRMRDNYDIVKNGLDTAEQTAYDDVMLYSVAMLREDRHGGQYDVSTRWTTAPINEEIEEMYQQDPTDILTSPQKGKNDGIRAPGGSGQTSIYNDGGDTGLNVRGYYDWAEGTESIPADTELVLDFFEDDDKWIIRADLDADTEVFWGFTESNWEQNGGDPKVSCKLVTGSPGRTSSTTSGDAFDVFLPRTCGGQDPNVVACRNIAFMVDTDGNRVCVSDYLDDKILTVKMWVGITANIPTGWAVMNGVTNSVGNGGSGIVMAQGSDKYFARATDADVEVGNAGGSDNSIIDPHTATEVVACIQDHNAADIDNHIAKTTGYESEHTHSGVTDSDGAHAHSGTASDATGDTDYAVVVLETHTAADVVACIEDHNANVIDTHAASTTGLDGDHTHSGLTQTDGNHSHTGTTDGRAITTDNGYANIGDHTGAEVAAVLEDHDASAIDTHLAGVTGSDGAHTHGGTTNTDGAHGHIGNTDASPGSTGDETTDITVDAHTALEVVACIQDHNANVIDDHAAGVTGAGSSHNHGGVTGGGTGNVAEGYADCEDSGHHHDSGQDVTVDNNNDGSVVDAWSSSSPSDDGVAVITDLGHTHGAGTHTHTIPAENTHTHATPVHTHTGTLEHTATAATLPHSVDEDPHSHSIGAHTHPFSIASSGAHNHVFTTDGATPATHTHTSPAHAHTGTLEHAGTLLGTLGHTDSGHVHTDGEHTHGVSLGPDGPHYHVIIVGDLSTSEKHDHTTPAYPHTGTLPHSPTLNDLSHTEPLPGHRHGLAEHTHPVVIPLGGPHYHAITGLNAATAHQHTISQYVHSGYLSHLPTEATLDHDAVDTIPPCRYVMYIERLDNSI